MNARKARQLRRDVFGDQSPRLRLYNHTKAGVISTGLRLIYQQAKGLRPFVASDESGKAAIVLNLEHTEARSRRRRTRTEIRNVLLKEFRERFKAKLGKYLDALSVELEEKLAERNA